jgi:hypothetical protein
VCYTSPVRIRACVATTIMIAAILLGACSSSSKPAGTTTTRESTSHGVPQSSKALESLIVTKIPSAFVKQPPEAYDTGPSDFAKAVKDDGEPDAATILRSEKFVRGYQRIWIGPEHAQIIVFIYQFESSAGARKDFDRSTQKFTSKPPAGTHRFVVPGLPAGRAAGIAGAENGTAVAVVLFTTGVFNVQVNCNGARPGGLQPRAVAIAQDQYRRL